ncbi:conserved Plasmodium protein, unknown function [Plasmodium vinckei brucechwatti]|uniref:Uncharacterized protein n=1 Tax=Plasmodium vinckei brucechwatti TaxID=119398 RepID=A0A6V7S4P3_PLAVN|nr:conserved Plasmodium protein, unknown function [Plasmodium vinckei brucechwatti]
MLGKMRITSLVVLYIQLFFFCKNDDVPFQSSDNMLNKSLMDVIHNNFNVNGIMKIIEKMFKNSMDDIEMEDGSEIQNMKIKEYSIDSNKYKLAYPSFKEYYSSEVENGKDYVDYMENNITQIANKIDNKFYSKHFKEINVLKHNLNELANLLKGLSELNNEIFYFFDNVIDSKNMVNSTMTNKSRRALPFVKHFEEMLNNLKNSNNSYSFHNLLMQYGDELNIIIKDSLIEYVYLHKQTKEHMKKLEKYMEKNVKIVTKMHKKIVLSILYVASDINKTNDKIDFLISKNLNEFKEWIIYENKKCIHNLKKIKSNIDFNLDNINEVFDKSKEELKNDYISFIDISKYLAFQNPNKTILSIIHFLNSKYSDDMDIIFLYNEEYVEFNLNDITYENDTKGTNDQLEISQEHTKFGTNFNFTDLDIIETSKYEEVLNSHKIDKNSNFKHINKNNFEKIIDDIILNNEMLENGTWIKEKRFQNNNNISYNDIYNEIQNDTKHAENRINTIDNNFRFKSNIINFTHSIKNIFNNFIFNFDNYLCSFEKSFDSQNMNTHNYVDTIEERTNKLIPIEKNEKSEKFENVSDAKQENRIVDSEKEIKASLQNEPNESEIKMNTPSVEPTNYQKTEPTEVSLSDLKIALKNKIMYELESAIKEIVQNEVSDILDDDFPDDEYSDELENYEKSDESNKINTKMIDAPKYESGSNSDNTDQLQANQTEPVSNAELDTDKKNIFSTNMVKKSILGDESDEHSEETDKQLEKSGEQLKESSEHLGEGSENLKESDEHLKESDENLEKPSNQIEETNEQLEETNEQFEETNEQFEETNEQLEETNEQLEETNENLKETEDQLDEIDEHLNVIGESNDMIEKEDDGGDIDDGMDENETIEKNKLNFSMLHSSNLKYLWRTPIIKQLYNIYIEHRKGYMHNMNDENIDIYEIDKNELEIQNNDANNLNFKEELKNIKDNIFYAIPDMYYIYDILDIYQKNKNAASSNNFFYNNFYGNDYLIIKSKGVNMETFIYPYFETLNLQLNESNTCASGNYYSCMKNYINNNIDKEKLNKKTVFIYLGVFKDEVFKLPNSKLVDDLKKFHLQQFLNNDMEYQFFNSFLIQKHKEESIFFRRLKFYTVYHSQRKDTLMYGIDFNFYVSYFSKGDIQHLPFSYYYDSIIYFKVILSYSKYGDQEIVPIDDDIINLGLMLSLDNKDKNVHYLIKSKVIEDTQYDLFKNKKGIVKLYKISYENIKIMSSKDKYKMHVTRNTKVILQKEVTFNSNNNKRTLYYIDTFYDKMSEIMKNNMNLELLGKTFFLHLEKK